MGARSSSLRRHSTPVQTPLVVFDPTNLSQHESLARRTASPTLPRGPIAMVSGIKHEDLIECHVANTVETGEAHNAHVASSVYGQNNCRQSYKPVDCTPSISACSVLPTAASPRPVR